MIDVKQTLSNAEEEMDMACMFLDEQLSHIRAGRANVALVDGIKVESYGSMVPINQVANISTPDPRTIAIRPWDKKAIRDIERAIINSNLGITPDNNGEIITEGDQIMVGGNETYRAICRKCWKNKVRDKIEKVL